MLYAVHSICSSPFEICAASNTSPTEVTSLSMDLGNSRSLPIPGLDVSLPPVTSAPLSALDASLPPISPSPRTAPRAVELACHIDVQTAASASSLVKQQPLASQNNSDNVQQRPVRVRWTKLELSKLIHGLALAGADLPRVARVVGTRNVNAVRKQLSSIAARIAPPPPQQPIIPPHVAARLILHHHGLATPQLSNASLTIGETEQHKVRSSLVVSRQKFPVQVVAALPSHAEMLRLEGHNPCVEILLGTHKTVWDIAFHLYGKWGRALAMQDPAARTLPISCTVEALMRNYAKAGNETVRLTYTLLDVRPDFDVVSLKHGHKKLASSNENEYVQPKKRKRNVICQDSKKSGTVFETVQPLHANRRRIFAASATAASEIRGSMESESLKTSVLLSPLSKFQGSDRPSDSLTFKSKQGEYRNRWRMIEPDCVNLHKEVTVAEKTQAKDVRSEIEVPCHSKHEVPVENLRHHARTSDPTLLGTGSTPNLIFNAENELACSALNRSSDLYGERHSSSRNEIISSHLTNRDSHIAIRDESSRDLAVLCTNSSLLDMDMGGKLPPLHDSLLGALDDVSKDPAANFQDKPRGHLVRNRCHDEQIAAETLDVFDRNAKIVAPPSFGNIAESCRMGNDNAMDSFDHEDSVGKSDCEKHQNINDIVNGSRQDDAAGILDLQSVPEFHNSSFGQYMETRHNHSSLGCFSSLANTGEVPQSSASLTFSSILGDLANSRSELDAASTH